MSNSNDRALQVEQGRTLQQILERNKGKLAAALPAHLDADRLVRLVVTECRRQPKLLQCDPLSVIGSTMQAAQLGLEVGIAGMAYLVPFWNKHTRRQEAQLIPGYRGLMELARRSGTVARIEAHVVRAGEPFAVRLGTDPRIEHEPRWDQRGDMVACYAVAHFREGGYQFEVMSRHDIEAHKAEWANTGRGDSPWNTEAEPEMWKKTVTRKLCKYLPMSVEVQQAVSLDELASSGRAQDNRALLEGEFTEAEAPAEAEEEAGAEAAPSRTARVAQRIANRSNAGGAELPGEVGTPEPVGEPAADPLEEYRASNMPLDLGLD